MIVNQYYNTLYDISSQNIITTHDFKAHIFNLARAELLSDIQPPNEIPR